MTSGLERFGTVARNYAAGQGENAAAAARGENAAIVFGEDGSELRGSAKRDAYRRWRNPTDEEMRLSIAENNKVRKEFLRQVQAHFTERGVVTIPRAVLKHLKLGDYKLDADGNVTSGKPLTARRICLVMRAIETVDASRAQALERANPLANEAMEDPDVGESFAGLVEKHALDEDTAAALRNLLDGFARNLARELVRDPGVDLQDAKNRVQDGMMGLLEQLDRFLGDRSVPRNDALGLLRSPLASYAAFTRPNVMHAGTFRMLKFLLDHPELHAGEPQELFDLLNRLDGVPARLLGADVERDLATAWDRHCGKVAETVNSHPAKPWTVRTVVRNLGLMGDAKLAQAFTGANFKSFLGNVKDAYRKQMTDAAKLPPPGGPGADDADLRRVVCDLALKHVLSARTDDARLVSEFVGTTAMDCALARVALAAGDSSGLSRILERFDQFVQDSALNREALNRGVDEKFQDLENKLKAELGDLADSVNTDFVREKMKSARSVEEAQDAADRFLAKVKELADLLKVGVSRAVAGALMKAVTGDKAFSMATAKLAADFVSSEDGMRLMGDLGRVRGTHDLWEKLNEIAGRILERGDQNAVREIGSDPGLRGQVLAFVMLTALDADPELGGKLEEMRTTVAGLYDQKFPEFRKRDDDAPQPGDLAAALKGETAFDLLGQLKSCMDSARMDSARMEQYLKTVNQIVGEKLDEIDRTKFDARDYDAALKLFRLEIDERKSQGDPSLENEINDPVAHYDKIAERFRRALDVVSPGLWSEKTQNERLATVESITSKFEAERLLETLFREKFGDPKDDPAVQDLHTAFRAANPGRDLDALKDALRGLVSGDGNLGGAVAPFLANMKAGLPPQDGRRAELIGAMVEGPLSEGRLEPLAAIRLARTIRDASPDRLEKLSNPAGFARDIREESFSTPSGAGKSPAVLFCERALAQTAAKSGAAALLAHGNPPAPNAFGQTVAQLAAARCRARLEAIKDDPAALAAFEDELEVELAQTLDVVLTELQVVAPDLADLADAFELAAPTQLDVAAAGKSDGAFTAFLAEMRERRQIAQELEKNAAALLPQGANLDQGVVRRLCALAAGRAFAVALSRTRVGGAPAAPTLRGEWDKVARDAKSADDFAGLAGQARERAMVLGRAYFRAFTGVRLVQERTLEGLEKEIDRRLTPEERTAYLAPDRLNDVTGDVVRTVEAAMAAAERAGSGDEGIDGELTRELARLDGKVAGRAKRLADGLRTAAEIDAIVPGAGTLCSDAVMGRGMSARLLGLVLQGVKDLKARKHDFEKMVAENEMRPEDFALALAREIAAVAQGAFVNGFDRLNEENAQNARDAYLKENPGADLDDVAVKEAISGSASVNALGTPDRVACMALTMEIAKLLMPDVMVHLTGLPSEQVQQVAQTLNDDAQRTAGDLTELTFEVQTRLYGEGVEGALSMSEDELSKRMTVGELQQYEQLQKRAPAALMEQTVSKVLSHE